MPCDSRIFRKNQTLTERKIEVKKAVTRLDKLLSERAALVKVGPQGAVTFTGWSVEDRAGITDACAFRRLMVEGSTTARAAIARAEQLAGRKVDLKTVANGVHSHDGGKSWHHGH